MNIEIIITLLGGVISLAFGGLFEKFVKPLYPGIEKIYNRNPNSVKSKILASIFNFQPKSTTNYSNRIQISLENLKRASLEIDRVMNEFAAISHERQETILTLETKLQDLTEKESALKSKIQTLEKVPLEAIKHFEDILSKGDKRSAYRDYMLFGIGVVVSVIVTIALKLFGF